MFGPQIGADDSHRGTLSTFVFLHPYSVSKAYRTEGKQTNKYYRLTENWDESSISWSCYYSDLC